MIFLFSLILNAHATAPLEMSADYLVRKYNVPVKTAIKLGDKLDKICDRVVAATSREDDRARDRALDQFSAVVHAYHVDVQSTEFCE